MSAIGAAYLYTILKSSSTNRICWLIRSLGIGSIAVNSWMSRKVLCVKVSSETLFSSWSNSEIEIPSAWQIAYNFKRLIFVFWPRSNLEIKLVERSLYSANMQVIIHEKLPLYCMESVYMDNKDSDNILIRFIVTKFMVRNQNNSTIFIEKVLKSKKSW